jgi:hypothetical protein
MNISARKHLAKAKDYLAKGDEAYRKAKPEIDAAHAAGASLREMSRYLDRSKDWVHDVLRWDGEGTLYGDNDRTRGTAGRQDRTTRKILRDAPLEQVEQIMAALEPEQRRKVVRAADNVAAKRQKEAEQVSDVKLREELGDETVDDLEFTEKLRTTEYLLISARGNLRGFVKNAGELGIDNVPSSWRESCLDWIEDLEGHFGMAKALLAGDDIDWTAFEEMLAKEVE